MFLGKVVMETEGGLKTGSLMFKQRHKNRYRYGKLGGETPMKALAASNKKLRFPNETEAPKHRLQKPETGKYHVARLLRSDLKLNIFGEIFPLPPELKLECVVCTINVKEQKLKLFLDKPQVEGFDHKLR